MIEQTIRELCRALLDRRSISSKDLVAALEALDLAEAVRLDRAEPTGSLPYGRHVLFMDPRLEVMIASWSRGTPCAPHDHGDAHSAIRVLRGRAHHRGFRVDGGRLCESFSEQRAASDILVCGPGQVHAMGDDGATDSLVTLHLYAGSIDTMVVYSDTHTHLVGGQAGAWLPVDDARDLVNTRRGHVQRAELLTA